MIRGQVKSTEIDENGNIKVITEYTNDTGDVIQQGVTRYSFSVDNDIASIRAKIETDVEQHCDALMKRAYARKRNADEIQNLATEIAKIPVKEVAETTLVQAGKILTVDELGVKGVIDAS
jgi:hypothetical protein